MKLTTKIALTTNAIIFAGMGYLFYDTIKEEKVKEAESVMLEVQSVLIAQEVQRQIEEAKQIQCLATNIYHEARNDGITGQSAVAWVTMNRTQHKNYPGTICQVVYQAELNENGIPLRNRCQFSWFCDGKSDDIEDQAAWNVASEIAEDVFHKYGKETDPTNGSIMYHAHYVTPYWASSYEKQARIDSHIFYN